MRLRPAPSADSRKYRNAPDPGMLERSCRLYCDLARISDPARNARREWCVSLNERENGTARQKSGECDLAHSPGTNSRDSMRGFDRRTVGPCGVLSRQIGRDRLEAAAGCVPKAPCGGRGYRTTR